jgi:multidrug efflux pump subunit AcrA (membrane-fusion protein)
MKKRANTLAITAKRRLNSIKVYINENPFKSFFIVLGIFVLLIVVNSFLQKPKTETAQTKVEPKKVKIYSIGKAPQVSVRAEVEKPGLVTIVSLTGGIVQSITAKEGALVNKGQAIVKLSSNYQGGNAAGVQRSIAKVSYDNIVDTYDTQKQIIEDQKQIANKVDSNTDDLRSITDKSLNETRNLISLNDSIVSSLDSKLQDLSADPVTNKDLILSTNQIKSQFVAANNQAHNALRNSEYAAGGDNNPAQLSDLQKDITLKQLDNQLKALDMNREISRLQVQLAGIQSSMMYPATPFSGTVQKIFVKKGQVVSPGTPLAIVSSSKIHDIKATIYVTADIASRISKIEQSTLRIGNKTYKAMPYFVSSEAVNGNLHAAFFSIPAEYTKELAQNESITIDVPLGYADTMVSASYVPLDAIYQTSDAAILFVMHNHKAQARTIELGNVYGELIEVQKGLNLGDEIILNRDILDGDPVTL